MRRFRDCRDSVTVPNNPCKQTVFCPQVKDARGMCVRGVRASVVRDTACATSTAQLSLTLDGA